jgi:hypothetical protein
MKQPAQKTVVTAQQVLEALAEAHSEFFHARKNPTALLILLAQSACETGWWRAMWNNNLGNYKSLGQGPDDWTFFRCYEYLTDAQIPAAWRSDARITINAEVNGKHEVWIDPDHAACCFMSFPTLSKGAYRYLEKLVRQYSDPNDQGPKDAWHWACQGDVEKFTNALYSHHYFTADPVQYAKVVAGCKKRLEGMKLNFDNLIEWPVEESRIQVIHPSIFNDDDNT